MIARRLLSLLRRPYDNAWRRSHIRRAHFLDGPGACVAALQACASRRAVSTGVAVHACAITRGFLLLSPSLVTALISFYSKCALPADALAVFRRLPGGAANLFQWNSAIAAMTANGQPREAVLLFREMGAAGLAPDEFTFPCVITACADLFLAAGRGRSLELRSLHCRLAKTGLRADVFVSSALVHGYMKTADSVDYALRVFDQLPERDVVLWNSMVNGLAQSGRPEEALRLFQRMAADGVAPSKFTITGVVSVFAALADLGGGQAAHALAEKTGLAAADVAVPNSLIDLYGKCGAAKEAAVVFDAMPERDLLSWNSMIAALVQGGDHGGALRLFYRMRQDGPALPDAVTASAVLPACAHAAALLWGREIHSYLVVSGLLRWRNGGDIFLHNAVMDMYAKCGSADEAMAVFEGMPAKDVASWNILIGGYAAKDPPAALRTFSRMCGEAAAAPDEVTFVVVLSACSRGGLVAEGRELLRRMQPEFGVQPTVEHVACAVDMLGRAGLLEEARELAAAEPAGSSPVVWRGLLSACQMHGKTELAAAAAERAVKMEPEHSGSFVLLSNAFSSAGRHREVTAIRTAMRGRLLRKTPGCSWIELNPPSHARVEFLPSAEK
ncbi:pentatricopeptide repeat-containing protein At3g14730-like [Wolffia australiana]